MNIFLSRDNIVGSIEDLDDLRLQKQLVEVYQLITLAIREKDEGHEIKAGHYHHPVYLFYKDNIPFLAYYGLCCGIEYCERFNKTHKLYVDFIEYCHNYCERVKFITYKEPKYTPYYMEGSKGQPNYIRTTENVGDLFKQKLIKKWNNDKANGRQPKWTNRDVPEFYKKEMSHE